MDVADIARRLDEAAESVISALRLDGEFQGAEYVAFNPTRADRKLGSFRINLGAKRGTWADFAVPDPTGRRNCRAGDMLDLVAYILNIDKAGAVRWARVHLGLADGVNATPEHRERDQQVKARRIRQQADQARLAQRIWLEGREQLRGTPAELYLKGRGIDLAQLGRQPRALRFHPSCYDGQNSKARWPAIVAAVHDAAGAFIACHRTFLEIRADGSVGKAPLGDGGGDAKLTLGRYAGTGACIRLWRGAPQPGFNYGKPIGAAVAGETIMVSEGIEDALTAVLAVPEWRAVAAISIGNIGALRLPVPMRVVIVGQNDTSTAAIAQLAGAVERLRRAGHTVSVPKPPEGFKDINDQVRGRKTG